MLGRFLYVFLIVAVTGNPAFAQCTTYDFAAAEGTVIAFDLAAVDQMRSPPFLTLDADGTARVLSSSGDGVLETHIPRVEVDELLREIILAEHVAAIDSAAMARASFEPAQDSAVGEITLGTNVVADAPTTFLKIDLPGCHISAQLYALRWAVDIVPENAQIQSFYRIERRLVDVALRLRGEAP